MAARRMSRLEPAAFIGRKRVCLREVALQDASESVIVRRLAANGIRRQCGRLASVTAAPSVQPPVCQPIVVVVRPTTCAEWVVW
jgi:hypothetical protein